MGMWHYATEQELGIDRPNAARMYDYYLGGAANFAVDRQAAERAPFVGRWARQNRSFLARAVRYLCAQGVDQFLDLGSGVPTVGNVHETAQAHRRHARVAYVDSDPIATRHAHTLLGANPQVTITRADLRKPQAVLHSPGVAGLLDFTRPVAILAVAVLHFIAEQDQPQQILAGYRRACVPGSYLAISHGATDEVHAELGQDQFQALHAAYRHTPTPVVLRRPPQIAALLHGYSLVEPGMVLLNDWRPDPQPHPLDGHASSAYALVGVLPEQTAIEAEQ